MPSSTFGCVPRTHRPRSPSSFRARIRRSRRPFLRSCFRRIAADRPVGPIAPDAMCSLSAGGSPIFGVHRNPHCRAPGCRWKDEPATVVVAEEHDLQGALITLGLNANATPRLASRRERAMRVTRVRPATSEPSHILTTSRSDLSRATIGVLQRIQNLHSCNSSAVKRPAKSNERERIADEHVVGPAEDRRFFVLVTATITFESIMPARCWIAPETPTAMYGCGAAILRVWPTSSGK